MTRLLADEDCVLQRYLCYDAVRIPDDHLVADAQFPLKEQQDAGEGISHDLLCTETDSDRRRAAHEGEGRQRDVQHPQRYQERDDKAEIKDDILNQQRAVAAYMLRSSLKVPPRERHGVMGHEQAEEKDYQREAELLRCDRIIVDAPYLHVQQATNVVTPNTFDLVIGVGLTDHTLRLRKQYLKLT